MPIFRSRLFEMAPDRVPKPPYKSRGWKASLRELTVIHDGNGPVGRAAQLEHHSGAIINSSRVSKNRMRFTFAPEIIIEANSRSRAQRAVNLITAAMCLIHSDFMFGDAPIVVGDNAEDDEDLRQNVREEALGSASTTGNYALAAAIAAKAGHSKEITYALVKYWLSLRICSIPAIEHHPRYGSSFGVEVDPFNHAIMAQSIVAAYSVIEQLDFAPKASREVPSKIDGKWNPVVYDKLCDSLKRFGIKPDDECVWLIRNTTRIEKKIPIPDGTNAEWARVNVRDRKIKIIDAIQYCSGLRSKVSAHRVSKLTKSLTMIHVTNVQHVARQLLLQTLRYWKKIG